MTLFILFFVMYSTMYTVQCYNVTLGPPIGMVRVGLTKEMNITLWFDEDELVADCAQYKLDIWSKAKNVEMYIPDPEVVASTNNACQSQFTMKGKIIGRTVVVVSVTNERNESSTSRYPVSVIRPMNEFILTKIFTSITTVIVIFTSTSLGTQLDIQILIDTIKRPWTMLVGLGCQLILMPLIAFAWGKLLLSGKTFFWYSYFAIGCAPGGGMSNMWTILMDGNLDLSATMTFASNIMALGNIPLWMYTLGEHVILKDENSIGVPFVNIASGLAMLIIPSIIGLLIKWKLRKVADFITKIIKMFMLIFIAFIIAFGTYTNRFVFGLITWRTILAGLLLPWSGFILGFVISYLIKRNWVDARTIGLETGIQNMKLAIIILQFSFKPPESDLAMVIPFCCLIFTPIPLLMIFVCYTIHNKCYKKFCLN